MSVISCVTPTTASRNQYLPLLLGSFFQQDYPDKELVVVSEDKIPLPSDPRIRFIKCAPDLTIGGKRNIACSHAQGEYIVHFDSDDYSAPGRLTHQMQVMEHFHKPVVGYHTIRFYDGQRAFKSKRGHPTWTCGTALMYTTEYWRQHPFQLRQIGEDTVFVDEAQALGAIVAVDGTDKIIARNHPGNTDQRCFDPIVFVEVPVERVRDLWDREYGLLRLNGRCVLLRNT